MATNNAVNQSRATFNAYFAASQTGITGDATVAVIACDTASINEGTVYNTGTGVMTAPITGNYLLGASAMLDSLTSAAFTLCQLVVKVNSTNYVLAEMNPYLAAAAGGYLGIGGTKIIPLTAGDSVTFTIMVSNDTKSVGLLGTPSWTEIYGCLVP